MIPSGGPPCSGSCAVPRWPAHRFSRVPASSPPTWAGPPSCALRTKSAPTAFAVWMASASGEAAPTPGQVNDFPLLVALDAARIDYSAVRADGADIEFRDADDTPLAHEIERWDPQGTSILWVRVPQIDAASNTDSIWMYYGDPAAQVAQDAVTVWGSYEEVYHLGDNGQVINDSSARNYDGTSLGTDPVAGFVGLAQNFAGAGQRVDLGNQRDFARAVAGLTIEAWVNPRASQNDGVVLGVARNADTT